MKSYYYRLTVLPVLCLLLAGCATRPLGPIQGLGEYEDLNVKIMALSQMSTISLSLRRYGDREQGSLSCFSGDKRYAVEISPETARSLIEEAALLARDFSVSNWVYRDRSASQYNPVELTIGSGLSRASYQYTVDDEQQWRNMSDLWNDIAALFPEGERPARLVFPGDVTDD